jgi:trans-aconitate 2-methyltransferase
MRETAREGPWTGTLAEAAVARERLLTSPAYYDILAPCADRVDIWRTEYQHLLADHDAICTWLRATGLKPFLDPLAPADRTSFLAAYKQRLEGAYRQLVDGRVLLAFPRLFIVARRAAGT